MLIFKSDHDGTNETIATKSIPLVFQPVVGLDIEGYFVDAASVMEIPNGYVYINEIIWFT